MGYLHIYVCENYAPEAQQIVARLQSDNTSNDIFLKTYPCMCTDTSNRKKARSMLRESLDASHDIVVLAGDYCGILEMVPKEHLFRRITNEHCFHHLASPPLIDFILSKGGYIVTSGWLAHWRRNLQKMGFSRDTAISFFGITTSDLIFFDTKTLEDAETEMEALSEYLGLPFVVIPTETRKLEISLKSVVAEWRLYRAERMNIQATNELQAQCAEYAAVLDLLTQIAQCTDKREIVDRVKFIFLSVMGATEFKFYDANTQYPDIPEAVGELNAGKQNASLKLDDALYISVAHDDRVFGVFEAKKFLFPEYVERYMNFANGISQICALALLNIERFEELLSYKEELEFKSTHDSLTGLLNRTYFDDAIEQLDQQLKTRAKVRVEVPEPDRIDDVERRTHTSREPLTLFQFDLDGLKYVNDNFGHLEGDKLIQSAANVLRHCYRQTDLLARVGGDEFTAIVDGCSKETAAKLKTRIQTAIAEHNRQNTSKHLDLSISMGYATAVYPYATNMHELRRKADEAMYEDKRSKRTTIADSGGQ